MCDKLFGNIVFGKQSSGPVGYRAVYKNILRKSTKAIGYYMVMYMASMSSVPESVYESANLDGAGRVTQFFRITLPLIWTNIRTCLLYTSRCV